MNKSHINYPKSRQELDLIPKVYDDFVSRLGNKYPGYNDSKYMTWLSKVRNAPSIINNSNEVIYYDELIDTWETIYSKLRKLHYQYACTEHVESLNELEQAGVINEFEVPSFVKINQFLKNKSGFKLVNVGGMIEPRTFLYALAHGIFYSTQYIRHSSVPFYSPEPDIVHEVMGHVPMLANAKFAKFSREIGKKAFGASDDVIDILAKVYFFTVEFGVINSKVLGAGILGSCQELELIGKGNGNIKPWDLKKALSQDFTLSDYQPHYANIKSLHNLENIFNEVDQYLA